MANIKILALAVIMAFGLMAAGAYSGEQASTGMGRPYSLNQLEGTYVKNHKGEIVGRITDFVADSEGRVAFAILAHGGFWRIGETHAAIPYTAFTYDREGKFFLLDITKEKLASAPAFGPRDLYSEKWAEDVYRYYGQQPYWTEGDLVHEGITPPVEEPARILDYPYTYPFTYY